MDPIMIHGLIDNVAILLALGLIYDVVAYKSWVENKVAKSLSGIVLGCIGIFVMLNPWELQPGLFFDTRSIVLSVGGLFFGTFPAIVAVFMTSALRIFQGGIGMYAGVGIIITSGAIGTLLRHYKLRNRGHRTLEELPLWDLFGLGLVVHVAMLVWMLALPKPEASEVLRRLTIPVITIFPLGTVLLGKFIISRVKRVRADIALVQSEERYRNFVDNAMDAFYLSDINGKILDVNTAACQALGYTRDELLKLYIADIDDNHTPGDLSQTRQNIMSGELQDILTNHRRKTGDIFPVETRVRHIGSSEEPLFLSLVRDISSRKKAEAILKESEDKLQLLIESSTDMVTQHDLEGRYTSYSGPQNNSFTAEDFVGKLPSDVFADPEIAQKITLEILEVINTGQSREFESNIEWLGSNRIFMEKIYPIYSEGNIVGVAKICSDITEQKQDEVLLRKSEAKFKTLTVSSPIGVFLNDPTGVLTYVNEKCPELIGVPEGEAKNFDWIQAIHPEDRELVSHAWSSTLAEGGEYHLDFRWLHSDGKIVWTHGNITPVKDDHDAVTMYIGTLTDITERKIIEHELRASERRFRNVAESMSDWIWEIDENGAYTYSSSNVETILGYQSDEIIGKTPFYFMDREEAARVGNIFADIIKDHGELRNIENWNLTKQGEIVCLLTSGVPVFDEEGSFKGYHGIDTDITDKKHAERELEKTISLLSAIFEAMPDALLAVSMDRNVISINKAFTRILEYTEEDMIGKNASLFYASKNEYESLGELRYNHSAEAQLTPYTVNYKKKGGTIFPGETLGVPIYSTSGEKIGFIGIIRDISDRLQLEDTLRQSQKLEAVGTMVGGISHELNNILQSIFLYGGLIQDGLTKNSELHDQMAQLLADGDRARDLVNQILTFSRKTKINYKAQTIHEVILSALNFERASLPSNIELKHSIPMDCGMIMCDKTQVHQILINLCNNAQHAMSDNGGVLSVKLAQTQVKMSDSKQKSDVLAITVSDTGVGMNKAILARIFDPFFTTKSLGEGTGLGLSVIHGIIEMMTGEIEVESEPGQGSTFKIYLPVVDWVVPEDEDRLQISQNPFKLSILLVDDEESIRKVTQTALGRKGFSVEVAEDGERALELFRNNKNKYDLIITDLSMPNMSGVELSQEIRDTAPKIPIILSTGHLGLEEMVQFTNAGISGFIQKPWTVDQLIDQVGKLDLPDEG